MTSPSPAARTRHLRAAALYSGRCLCVALAAGVVLPAAAQSIETNGRPAAVTPASVPQQVQVTPDGNLLSSPHTPRTGAYSVKHVGDRVITARCLEGGTVLVAKNSVDKAPGHTPAAKRDAALRQSCRDVDFTK